MQMTTYRNKSQIAAITTTEKISDEKINVSVNTTGWDRAAIP